MPFELYFAGTSYREVLEYAMQRGIPKLFSQVTERPATELFVQRIREGTAENKLFIDSGAYTVHTKGADLDVDDYIMYVNERSDALSLIAQVDTIPGVFGETRTEEDIALAPLLSWENYLYMRERLVHPHKLMPIFHQDEDFKWLSNMLEWRGPNGEVIPRIGISAAKDKSPPLRTRWYAEVFEVIQRSSRPKVETHAFGTSSTQTLEMFPFTSADATTWIMLGAFGLIMTDYGSQPVSNQMKGAKKHIASCPMSFEALTKYVKSYGFEIEDLMESKDGKLANAYRQMFNMAYLHKWAQNYVYKGPKHFRSRRLI